jgi:hypothetical protein
LRRNSSSKARSLAGVEDSFWCHFQRAALFLRKVDEERWQSWTRAKAVFEGE